MKEFKKGLSKTGTFIVPYGSVEAHGTHLPLSTDTIIIVEAVRAAAERMPLFVAPPVHYGVCTSTGKHPGTITITPDTLRALTRDIVTDGARKGFENFILISGHGGGIHTFALKEAGEELMRSHSSIRIAALNIYEILGKEARDIAETSRDSHAGEIETSLLLHLCPELVKGRSAYERPALPKPIIVGDKVKYWPGAVDGDPSKANPEKGERVFNLMVESILALAAKLEACGEASPSTDNYPQ